MTTILKSLEGLNDLECKKGQLSSQPPIQYVSPTDLLTTKESSKNLKAKHPAGTIFDMTIFSRGNSKEYLVHIVAILHLINQKGLNLLCKKVAEPLQELAETLGALHKSIGSKCLSFKEDQEAHKVEIKKTQEVLEEARKMHSKAMTRTYELLRNLLSGDTHTQWDQICCKMHKNDLWAGGNGQVTIGRCPHLWTAFQDCLELHKFAVVTADAAKRQQYYIQQVVCKPQRATVGQHISCMGVLLDYVKYLHMLKDSPKAVPVTKKGNVLFSKADLAAIMLASVPMTWQIQYNLIHLTVPKLLCMLLIDLENIQQVMVEKFNETLKAKGKATTACPGTKSDPKRKASGGSSD
jgi:hypothetical protein